MRLIKILIGVAGGAIVFSAHAIQPFGATDTEIQSLPPYCAAKFKGGPEAELWKQTLGNDFLHLHHYCNGLNHINRYYRAKREQDKRYYLKVAHGNLQYMVKHAEPTFSLMPDIYMSLGQVYLLMNQSAQAITHFNKAIELNPRQPRAYNALSDYYIKNKQSAKALEIVTIGLRHNPDTQSLQRRYTELGGKLPYPEPFEPTRAVDAEAAKLEELATSPLTPSSVEPAASPTSVQPALEEPIAEPQIGSPTNPYCRFCPD